MKKTACAMVLIGAFASNVFAETHTVDQIGKQFSVKKLVIKAGDSVNFVNSDTVQHNVFSLSDIKSFDLGTYPKGESKTVKFDKPGVVEVECSIHPDMQMIVEVK